MLKTQVVDGQSVELMVNDDPKMLESFAVGDASRQGDIYVVAIGSLPKSANRRENRQLAEGDTQGSRHVLVSGDVYECDKSEVAKAIKSACNAAVDPKYIGPVFVGDGTVALTHPEHGDQGFPAGQVCAVVYQRSLDAEMREQRVRD